MEDRRPETGDGRPEIVWKTGDGRPKRTYDSLLTTYDLPLTTYPSPQYPTNQLSIPTSPP